MKPRRTGLNLCSGANLPFGFHQSSARREKRSTSAASTLEPSAWVMKPRLLQATGLAARRRRFAAGAWPAAVLLASSFLREAAGRVSAGDEVRRHVGGRP